MWPYIRLCTLCAAQKHPGHVVKPMSFCSHRDYGGGTGQSCFLLHPSLKTRGVFYLCLLKVLGEKPTDQHHGNPHVTSTKHMVRPGLPTHSRSVLPLPIFPVNLISRFLDTCLSQASCVSCPSRPGSSHAAYPAPTAQLSLTNSLQALPTSGRTGPPSVHVGCGGRTGMS